MVASAKRIEQVHEDVSIIMAVYNHEETLAAALESALMQEMPYHSKIHCFNDASTDGSASILASYAARYPEQIKVYTTKETQGSGKKNILYHSPDINGRYFCLLAGDDYWTSSDKLAKQVAFLDAHAEYVGCSCNTIMRNEKTGEETLIEPGRNSWNIMDLMRPKRPFGLYVHTSSILWHNIYRHTGCFFPPAFCKPEMAGDVMLMHMMLAQGQPMHNIPEVMSCYRVTGKGVWTSLSTEEQARRNKLLAKQVRKATPLKFRVFSYLWLMLRYVAPLNKYLPRPIND